MVGHQAVFRHDHHDRDLLRGWSRLRWSGQLTLRALEGCPPRIAVTTQVILPLAGVVLPPLGVLDHVAQHGGGCWRGEFWSEALGDQSNADVWDHAACDTGTRVGRDGRVATARRLLTTSRLAHDGYPAVWANLYEREGTVTLTISSLTFQIMHGTPRVTKPPYDARIAALAGFELSRPTKTCRLAW
jgi:hypothetical protein